MSYDVVPVENAATKWRNRSRLNGPFKALRKCLSLGISHSRSSHVLECHRPYTLKTLVLQSNMFLLPPFSGWVCKILNTAPLTRLDLINVGLSYRFFALIFGGFTIPTLEHLRIITCQFAFDAFAEFLSRHNTISTFDFISEYAYRRQLPITTLPALVSLISDPNNVDNLLTPVGAFPKLALVRVVIHLPLDGQFKSYAVEDVLARAAMRLSETNIRLCLDILPHSIGAPRI
jgi:hypothetical protein